MTSVTVQYSFTGPKREGTLHFSQDQYIVIEILEHADNMDAVCLPAFYPLVACLSLPDLIVDGNPYEGLGNERGGSGYDNLPSAIARVKTCLR